MERLNSNLRWAVILSQLPHLLCCGLPALFSILSVMSGIGLIGSLPTFFEPLHEIIHGFELPVLIASGVILLFGWGLYFYSRKLDCTKESSCSHEPCGPKKRKSSYILIGATVLFVINISIFLFIAE